MTVTFEYPKPDRITTHIFCESTARLSLTMLDFEQTLFLQFEQVFYYKCHTLRRCKLKQSIRAVLPEARPVLSGFIFCNKFLALLILAQISSCIYFCAERPWSQRVTSGYLAAVSKNTNQDQSVCPAALALPDNDSTTWSKQIGTLSTTGKV